MTRWSDDDSQVSSLQGPYFEQAPPGIVMPYCVFSLTASPVESRGNSGGNRTSRYENTVLEFEIFGDTGAHAVDLLAQRLQNTFNNAPLALDEGNLLYCRYVGERWQRVDNAEPNVRSIVIEYEVARSVVETTSPE